MRGTHRQVKHRFVYANKRRHELIDRLFTVGLTAEESALKAKMERATDGYLNPPFEAYKDWLDKFNEGRPFPKSRSSRRRIGHNGRRHRNYSRRTLEALRRGAKWRVNPGTVRHWQGDA